MAATREAGRPFTISEFNQPFPNSYAAEIDPTLAAFAAFQDWDALIHFAWEHGREWDRGGPSGFNLNGDWTKWPNVGQSARIFRTGAVAPAKEEVCIPLPYEARLDSARKKTNGSATAFLKSSAKLRRQHRLCPSRLHGHERQRPVARSREIRRCSLSRRHRRADLRPRGPSAAHRSRASRRHLRLHRRRPATAGPVTVESHGFIAFLLTALDNRPLDQSAHMLLSLPGPGPKLIRYPGTTDWWTLASPDSHPSGAYVVTGPLPMERTDCVLHLRGVTVYPLDGSGKRQPALERAERIHPNAATPSYELTR